MMKSRPRVRRSPEQWRKILDDLESSGLERKTFCEQNGLRREALRRAELRLGQKAPMKMPFVEVAAAAPSTAWDIELELGDGLVLRLARR